MYQYFLCAEIRVYEREVIVVPMLLLTSFVVLLVFILLLHFCPERVDRLRPHALKSNTRRVLHGIDGRCPSGRNTKISAERCFVKSMLRCFKKHDV